ncbi:hypothetical protein P43SY_000525 [Pythium insidiosum]|uniref:WRKY domain-containing protein n=1 Tax=Pythium insidiosum TaxID=114742 RepID=A0AAD5MEW3_PYTIN|nr:hypothetical protein P43SY_000525 [Pythium insidiosum]
MYSIRDADGSPSSRCYYTACSSDDGCCYRRKCDHCLRQPGCMINTYGECVDQVQDRYNQSKDFRLAKSLNLTMPTRNGTTLAVPQAWHFPALEATYCPIDDVTCGPWMNAQRYNANQTRDSRYCVGLSSCVAISVCEARYSDYSACARVMEPRRDNSDMTQLTIKILGVLAPALIAIIGCLLCCCCKKKRNRRRQVSVPDVTRQLTDQQRDRDELNTDEQRPRTQLDLAGWRVEQSERIERERLRLAGADDVDVLVAIGEQQEPTYSCLPDESVSTNYH